MTIQKYVKKPVVIEAVQWDGTPLGAADIIEWILLEDGTARYHSSDEPQGPCLVIDTLEGAHFARPSDWIIRGIKGEFYPCKPDIFEETYNREW